MVPVNESFEREHRHNYNESKAKFTHDELTTTKKTDDVDDDADGEYSTKECITNDMETLYWHTHGSVLWQR